MVLAGYASIPSTVAVERAELEMEERLLNFIVPHLIDWGYYFIFVMAFLETSAFVGLVVPGESAIVLGGFCAGMGLLNVAAIIGVGTLGAVLGDTVGYFLGYRYGEPFFRRYGRWFGIRPDYLDDARDFFARHGGKTVFLGRFMAWLRAFAPVAAGIARMPYHAFFVANVSGAIAWVTTFTVMGYFVGNNWNVIEKYLGRAGIAASLAGIIVFLAYRRIVRRHRARRRGLEDQA